ncbi:hypothetical protein D3C78_1298420 [compost metagenome]
MAVHTDQLPAQAHHHQRRSLLHNADQAGVDPGFYLLPLLTIIDAGEQIAAQPVGQQQVFKGGDAKIGAGVGRLDFFKALLARLKAQQYTLFTADVERAIALRQSIQMHSARIVGALEPGLPGAAGILTAQDHAKGTYDKAATAGVE